MRFKDAEREQMALLHKTIEDPDNFTDEDLARLRIVGEQVQFEHERVFKFQNRVMWFVLIVLVVLGLVGVFK